MKSIHHLLLVSGVLVSLGVLACSSQEAAAPSRPPTPSSSSSSGGADGGNPEGGASKDCFDTTKAKPIEPKHFLNQCNGTECFPFDNGARIEGYTAGASLPPLN